MLPNFLLWAMCLMFVTGTVLFLLAYLGFARLRADTLHPFCYETLTPVGQQMWKCAYALTLGSVVLAITIYQLYF